jgi:glyceraldehyde-3-phosphate dehydrogenase/erythrose-4-phosphate dehydrogenase
MVKVLDDSFGLVKGLMTIHPYTGDPGSCVFDSLLGQADAELVKIFGWYDNERG